MEIVLTNSFDEPFQPDYVIHSASDSLSNGVSADSSETDGEMPEDGTCEVDLNRAPIIFGEDHM